jgi:hypothetical protein
MPLEVLPPLVVFAVLILSVTLQALAASGHFPAAHRRLEMQSRRASIVLWLSIDACVISLAAGLWLSLHALPWQAVVIAGGLAVLAGPIVLQQFSDRFVDSWRALISFAACSAACALLLWLIA